MNRIKLIIIALLILASASFVFAESFSNVSVQRIAPSSAYLGQKIWVVLAFENHAGTTKMINVTEQLKPAGFNVVDAKAKATAYGETLYYYDWQIKLRSNQNTSVAYWITPEKAGSYVIPPAKIRINGTDFYMKSQVIEVKCNIDNICQKGEDYINCPEDCKEDSADGACISVSDGICDIDCAKGVDPDCRYQFPVIYVVWGIVGILALIALVKYIRYKTDF
jgi:hypothetical protein